MTEQDRLIITTLTAAIHQKKFTSSISYLGYNLEQVGLGFLRITEIE